MRQSFEVTQNQRCPQSLGQASKLVVDNARDFGGICCRSVARFRQLSGLKLASAPLPSLRPRSRGHPPRNRIEPRPERPLDANELRLANQYQKDRLNRIIDIMRIEEDLPANIPHHRPMAMKESLERQGVLALDEALQNLPVRHARECTIAEHTGNLDRSTRSQSISHRCGSLLGSPYVIYARMGRFNPGFLFFAISCSPDCYCHKSKTR